MRLAIIVFFVLLLSFLVGLVVVSSSSIAPESQKIELKVPDDQIAR